jgi:hypothetical protein
LVKVTMGSHKYWHKANIREIIETAVVQRIPIRFLFASLNLPLVHAKFSSSLFPTKSQYVLKQSIFQIKFLIFLFASSNARSDLIKRFVRTVFNFQIQFDISF